MAIDEEPVRKYPRQYIAPQPARQAAEKTDSGPGDVRQPLFNHEVLLIEHQFVKPKHHRRAFEELSTKWQEALAACRDLPARPSQTTIDAWVIMAWGGQRYCVTVQLAAPQTAAWLSEFETMICSRLGQ